jgi:hypothetical protein
LGLLAIAAAGCLGPDAVVPAGLEGQVVSARQALLANWDRIPRPELRFVEARCRSDGGLVIVFEQGGLGVAGGYSIAMAGPGRSDPDAWGGGFGILDPDSDPEVRQFLLHASEVPC